MDELYYVYKRSDGYINCSEQMPEDRVVDGVPVTYTKLAEGLEWADAVRKVEELTGGM